jgi:hydrogenase large subunit
MEETAPNYTRFQPEGKYSWVKAPNFKGKPAQVGPLAHVLAMYAAGHGPTREYAGRVLSIAGKIAGTEIPLGALHSTIGRHAARAVRAAVLSDTLDPLWKRLVENIGKGDLEICNQPSYPKGEIKGFGFHDAPRGTLSHWVVIEDGKIRNYQAVVPSTWNAGPRNHDDQPGPYEASLVGNPMADPERPLEVLRTVHSFDPCLACAIHMMDDSGGEIVKVRAL